MQLKLEIITPVHIGSGEVLSSYSDYVCGDGYIYYMDHETIVRELAKKPDSDNLIDSFIEIIKGQAGGNNAYKMKFIDLLEKVSLDYKKTYLQKVRATEKITEQINLHIKTVNQAYIPGSTLKGAIRTALLGYHYQAKEEKMPRSYIGEDIFDKFDKDILKFLSISDSTTFEDKDLRICKFYRYNLDSSKTTIPIVNEVIDSGQATFSITCKAEKKQVSDKFYYLLKGQEKELLPFINKYTQKNIEIELKALQKSSGKEAKKLKDFYNRLLDTIENIDSSKEAILRIGSGKTYFDNTIGQKISKDKFYRIIKDNFKKADPNRFPKTRTILIEKAETKVPGWVKISL